MQPVPLSFKRYEKHKNIKFTRGMNNVVVNSRRPLYRLIIYMDIYHKVKHSPFASNLVLLTAR